MTSARAVQPPERAKGRARGCLTSIVVGVVVVALLLAWLNHEITSTLNGDKAAAQFERAQDRFGDRWGVLRMYHDEFGNTTMELAPVAVVAVVAVVADARSDARRDFGSSGIEIEIDPAEAE